MGARGEDRALGISSWGKQKPDVKEGRSDRDRTRGLGTWRYFNLWFLLLLSLQDCLFLMLTKLFLCLPSMDMDGAREVS